ncbi:hypothetical protein BDQ17DRAFT_1328997 [Cyathus striatus]|nr:hypothetical protein BDQ17DRAFT_1328997 [Cyathus striatus]
MYTLSVMIINKIKILLMELQQRRAMKNTLLISLRYNWQQVPGHGPVYVGENTVGGTPKTMLPHIYSSGLLYQNNIQFASTSTNCHCYGAMAELRWKAPVGNSTCLNCTTNIQLPFFFCSVSDWFEESVLLLPRQFASQKMSRKQRNLYARGPESITWRNRSSLGRVMGGVVSDALAQAPLSWDGVVLSVRGVGYLDTPLTPITYRTKKSTAAMQAVFSGTSFLRKTLRLHVIQDRSTYTMWTVPLPSCHYQFAGDLLYILIQSYKAWSERYWRVDDAQPFSYIRKLLLVSDGTKWYIEVEWRCLFVYWGIVLLVRSI